MNSTPSEHRTRALAFMLARRLFEAPVDAAFAAQLRESGAASALLELDDSPAMRAVTEQVANADSGTLATWENDYTRLFVGPAAPAAPFWESVYLDDRELLFLPSTSEVRRIYESEGLQVAQTAGREAEDSLPHMLDFLATLAQRMDAAEQAGNAAEIERLAQVSARFERQHMADWLPAFAARAAKAPVSAFYPALCQAINQAITADAARLDASASKMAASHSASPKAH